MKKIIAVVLVVVFGAGVYMYLQGNDTTLEENQADATDVQSQEDEAVASSSDDVQAREEDATETATDTATQDLDYENGDYEAESSYTVPNGTVHNVRVALSINDDAVSDVSVYFNDQEEGNASTGLQEEFMASMPELVVGEDIDSLELSRVGGASLTTEAFNDALAQIKAEAQL